MDNTPRVSVITSVYNGLPYLPEAVESILDQSLSDYEYLVVDDGSTDGSWDVLTELARRDRRMRLLRNPANAGFARSQNRALESACGRYVACQDQDDISEPTRLERQVAFLEAHPEVGALGTWPAFIDEGGRPLANGRFPLLADNESLQRQLILGFGFVGPSLLARRTTLIDLGGYNPEMSAAEDYDLLLRLAEVGQVANLPEPLYRYRQHPQSVSSSRSRLQMHNIAVAREQAARRRASTPLPSELEDVIARTFLRAALLGLKRGELDEARLSLAKALEHDASLLEDGSAMAGELERFLKNEGALDRLRLYRLWFGELLPRTPALARLHARLSSDAHMQEAFAAAARREWNRVRKHWAQAVAANPRWLLNRGVWAIGLRPLVARGGSHRGDTGPVSLPEPEGRTVEIIEPASIGEVRS